MGRFNRGMKRDVFSGFNNSDLDKSIQRLHRGQSYKDLSTVWVTPTRGVIPAKVVSSYIGLMKPMNQAVFGPLFIENMEVGDAYNHAVELILGNPQLSKFKYLLTSEEDNCPPSDGLLKLYESMDKFDAVSGLYWTKGEAGMPMCYGAVDSMPKSFIPQLPPIDCVKEYNGLGMGFCLFKLSMFKKLPKPWFKTLQTTTGSATQDLFFFQNAGREGYRFCVDGRVKVGHWDQSTQTMW
jgi:hypothetical protein